MDNIDHRPRYRKPLIDLLAAGAMAPLIWFAFELRPPWLAGLVCVIAMIPLAVYLERIDRRSVTEPRNGFDASLNHKRIVAGLIVFVVGVTLAETVERRTAALVVRFADAAIGVIIAWDWFRWRYR